MDLGVHNHGRAPWRGAAKLAAVCGAESSQGKRFRFKEVVEVHDRPWHLLSAWCWCVCARGVRMSKRAAADTPRVAAGRARGSSRHFIYLGYYVLWEAVNWK